jgi:hypothetical protein
MDLDELEFGIFIAADASVYRLDQRALAHTASAPQQDIVCGQSTGKPLGIVDEDVTHPIDALEQGQVDPIHSRDWLQGMGSGMPNEGVGAIEIDWLWNCRYGALDQAGQSVETVSNGFQV